MCKSNQNNFYTVLKVLRLNTKKKKLYTPTANLYTFQKGITYSGVRIFNRLPSDIYIYIYIYTHTHFTDPLFALSSGMIGCILGINFINILL